MSDSIPVPTPPPRRKKRWGCLTLLALVCLLGLAWCHHTPLNRFPKEVITALQQDSEAILYSLDYRFDSARFSSATGFHGNAIFGQTRLDNAEDRRAMAALLEAATHGAWDYSACFYPRHGFRIHSPSGVYDLVLCFECGKAAVHAPDGRIKYVRIAGKPDFLNAYLRARSILQPDSLPQVPAP